MHDRRATDRATATGETVLIVDDEAGVRTVVERAMRQAGFRTAVAADGAEAIRVAAGLDSLDLLITDRQMPEMHSAALARELRTRAPRLKVLYLASTGDAPPAEPPAAGEALLVKPQHVDALVAAATRLLRGGSRE